MFIFQLFFFFWEFSAQYPLLFAFCSPPPPLGERDTVSLVFSFLNFLYILYANPLSDVYLAIFFLTHSIGFHFTWLTGDFGGGSFAVQKLFVYEILFVIGLFGLSSQEFFFFSQSCSLILISTLYFFLEKVSGLMLRFFIPLELR